MAKTDIKEKKVVILLPTYNEKGVVGEFIKEVFEQEKNAPGWKFEILIVDDVNSTKENKDFVKKLASTDPRVHLIENSPSGLGEALIQGHEHSLKNFQPDALAQLDADGQVEANVLPRLLGVLDEGYDLAIGSRFVPGGRNLLSPSRKFFTAASSIVSRIVMGPFDIKEWSNSARAFTPALFKKIDMEKVPYHEKSFIIQPSFLQAAVQAGAKYKEVPLTFKNRAEGYSKMKIFNYSYDVLAYSIDVRLKKMGLPIPIFKISRRTKTIMKFSVVGLIGTIVDFTIYKFLINQFGLPPATSKVFSTEGGIINNFLFNNFWTFRNRKVSTNIYQRFGIYNLVSVGGLIIGVSVIKILHHFYGDGTFYIGPFHFAYNTLYFIATIPPAMAWNFTANHFVTWRHKKED